jgi:hypothetical protein
LNPAELDNEFYSEPETQVPLGDKYKKVLFDDLDWHDLAWSDCSVTVKGSKVIEPLRNFKLYKRTDLTSNTLPLVNLEGVGAAVATAND